MSCSRLSYSIEIFGIFISMPIQHFFDVATLSSIRLADYVQRRNVCMSTSTWPEFCTGTVSGRSCFSPLARYSRDTCVDRVADAFGASCSNRTVFLNLSSCPSFDVSDRSSFANGDISHYVLFVFDCMSIRHLLLSLGSPKHTSCTSLNSSSFPLFQSLCLGDSVSVCTHPCLSRQGSLNDLSDSFSTFVVLWFDRSSMRCQRCTNQTKPPVSTDNTWNLLGSASRILSTAILGNGGPAPSLSAVTLFVNSNPRGTICHGVPHKHPQFVASHASLSVCLVERLPRINSVLGDAQNCSCSIMMAIEDSLESCGLQKN